MVEPGSFAGLFESVPQGLVVHDPDTGEIVAVNERWCEMHGYTREEALDLSIEDVTAEGWTPPADPAALVRKAAREGRVSFEWYGIDGDGENFWMEVDLVSTRLDGEAVVLANVRDITTRKEREQQLRVLDRVLRHNLYNDMNVVRSRAELIRRQTTGEPAETAAGIIAKVDAFIDTADKEREIVKVILEGGERAHVDVAEQTRRHVERLQSTHPAATIETTLPTEATAIATIGFGRAIEELIENAIVHADHDDPTVSVTVEATEEAIEVHVADDGPGIPAQEVDVLTEERAIAPLYHGSGLGLWLVNWIVRQSGGEVSFAENEPRGSIVTVRQPRPGTA